MLTLKRSASRGIESGRLLPAPFKVFRDLEIDFRTSSITLVAGPPGSMKSILATNIIDKMEYDDGRKPTCLYFSNDTNERTTAARVLAMRTDTPTRECQELLVNEKEFAASVLGEWSHVALCYKKNPDLPYIIRQADAYAEIWGDYPDQVIIDILMNVDYDGAGEMNFWDLMKEFNILAEEWDTHLVIVHHTSESAKAGSPPPRSALMGKNAHLPAVILTLWGDSEESTLDIAKVKNRNGKQDPEAKHPFRMRAHADKNRLEEIESMDVLFHDGVGVPENVKVDRMEGF